MKKGFADVDFAIMENIVLILDMGYTGRYIVKFTNSMKTKNVLISEHLINNEKKMLHKNQLPGIMLQNGRQVQQLLGH